jgi:hypothetical protein
MEDAVGLITAGSGPAMWAPPFGGPPVPYAAQPPAASRPGMVAPAPGAARKPEIWAAVRDASLIFAVSAALGFVIVVAGGSLDLTTVGVLNIACLLVGFTIAAVWARGNRAMHLAIAGLTTWILGLLNILLGVAPLVDWFFALPLIVICAAVAGLVSLLFKRRRS